MADDPSEKREKGILPMTRFWDWVDNRAIIRRGVLLATLWLTWESFLWAAFFATTTAKPGIEVAAIIAAVTAPISALQGWVFKIYGASREAKGA